MATWRSDYIRTIGFLLKARRNCGLSQIDVAVRIEVSRRTFQRYERGDLEPPAMLLFRWAAVVGVRIASNLTHGEA